MVIITGAAGFIGSCLVGKLNSEGIKDIVVVDDFTDESKEKNLEDKFFAGRVDRKIFFDWAEDKIEEIDFIFHIGARTDTTEFNKDIFDELNLNYSKKIWALCAGNNIPLIYASSAATYGLGSLGYDDNHEIIQKLKPLNPYGESKNEFDKWALKQNKKPDFWIGLKFFNVYGPNEYHKGRMASVVFHSFNQIIETGKVKLFKSHNPAFEDGKQLRDFIYVKDVLDVCYFLMQQKEHSGIYNLGTGKARTFLDLTNAVFKAMNKKPEIVFIDTPEDIREKYQYFTEAKMNKLFSIGYKKPFANLEDGIADYIK
ncbi:MAG: ADP-glyceromanno-heptose 6-epimerase, partial [Bacteroidales bacterium]|nr:ADP-glyceromanno-heptose 6-epimerase [Bacteroidales bacterium]